MKIFFIILIFTLLYSCKEKKGVELNNYDNIIPLIESFESKFPLSHFENSIPYKSYEVGFFKNNNDTLIYIQKNEVMFYENYSNFFNHQNLDEDYNIKIDKIFKLEYSGSLKSKKGNYFHFYSNFDFNKIPIKINELEKIDLSIFSFKNFDQDDIVDFNLPDYEIFKIKKGKIEHILKFEN